MPNEYLKGWVEQNRAYSLTLARMLAQERVNVEVSNTAATASFDLKSRRLVLPQINPTIGRDGHDYLVAHECGHAIYTDYEQYFGAIKDTVAAKSLRESTVRAVYNAVEDIRIESRMAATMPGLESMMERGRKNMYHSNVCDELRNDIATRGIESIDLLGRINIEAKFGRIVTVPFYPDEQSIVDAIRDKIVKNEYSSIADVREVAELIIDAILAEPEDSLVDGDSDVGESEPKLGSSHQEGSGKGESETDESDDSSQQDSSSEANESGYGEPSKDGESKPNNSRQEDCGGGEPKIDGSESKSGSSCQGKPTTNIDDIANESWNSEIIGKCLAQEPTAKSGSKRGQVVRGEPLVIKAEQVVRPPVDLRSCPRSHADIFAQVGRIAIQHHKKTAVAMASAFKRMMDADEWRRTSSSESGRIDPTKVSMYRVDDRIFRSHTVTADGKSHGIVMFVDWSDSMSDKIVPTVHQMISMVCFAREARIPFAVYTFDNMGDGSIGLWSSNQLSGVMNLRTRITSDMDANEFAMAVGYMLMVARMNQYGGCANVDPVDSEIRSLYRANGRASDQLCLVVNGGTTLYGTPLNSAIVASVDVVNRLKQSWGVQIAHTVFLTDGQSSSDMRMDVGRSYAFEYKSLRFKINVPGTDVEDTATLVRYARIATDARYVNFFVGMVDDGATDDQKSAYASSGWCEVPEAFGFDSTYFLTNDVVRSNPKMLVDRVARMLGTRTDGRWNTEIRRIVESKA